MILPTSPTSALLLLALSLIALGSWLSTWKIAGKWRFELFYYDYAVGTLLCAVVAAFTFGSLVSTELTFQDNLLIASKRQMFYAVAGGLVFNLGNIMLVAASAVSGMAVAFPIVFGLAAVIGLVSNYSPGAPGSVFLLFGGALVILVGATLAGYASGEYRHVQNLAIKAAPVVGGVRMKPPAAAPSAGRGIFLSIVGGIFMGLFMPLVDLSRDGESGVAPYGVALLFAVGVLISTLLYVPFFSNFPVVGKPIEISAYFKGTRKQHLLGMAGGIVWMVGTLAVLAVPAAMQVNGLGFALVQGVAVLGALWGLFVWHDFKGAEGRVKTLILLSIGLYALGIVLVAVK